MKATLSSTPTSLATAYGQDVPCSQVKIQLITGSSCSYGRKGSLDFTLALNAETMMPAGYLSDIWVSGTGTVAFQPF